MEEAAPEAWGEERERLLLAVLPHVPFDGWSRTALEAGAADLGLAPERVAELFPRPAADLVAAFSRWADAEMLRRLEAQDLAALKLRQRVAAALRCRFETLLPYREAVRRSLGVLALPQNLPLGVVLLAETSDRVWTGVGDRSTDQSWYSKRLLLGGVVSAATLYWMEDRSEGQAATWSFIDRRLDEVVRLGGRAGRTLNRALSLPDRLLARGSRRFGRRF